MRRRHGLVWLACIVVALGVVLASLVAYKAATTEPVYSAATVIAGMRANPKAWAGRTILPRGTVWMAMTYRAHSFGSEGRPFPEGVWIGPPNDDGSMPRSLRLRLGSHSTWMDKDVVVKAVVVQAPAFPAIGAFQGTLILMAREENLSGLQRAMLWAGLDKNALASPVIPETQVGAVYQVHLTRSAPCPPAPAFSPPCPDGDLFIPVP